MNISISYKSIYHIIALAIMLLLYSCASTGNPSGGSRDKIPPKILDEKSTTNFQTNFTKQQIELNFDEFINLKNPQQQVVVSPPLIYPLQFDHRGKRVRINFHEDEILKDDVTYSISFGDAIEDFRESNKLENLKFVFGTGDILDSLSFTGSVLDSYTREPAKDILVMLYDTLYRDSIPYQDRPYYFAKTDEDGKFRIENMKSDTFRIFALGDANLNYIYDQDTELIGFSDSLYIISDSMRSSIEIEIFTGQTEPSIFDVNKDEFGVVRLEFDQSPVDVSNRASDTIMSLYPQIKKDSLLLWYDMPSDTLLTFFIQEDTINININTLKKSKTGPLTNIDVNAKLSSGIMKGDSLKFTFNHPLSSIDTDLIKLHYTNDTLEQALAGWKTGILSNDPFGLYITYSWKEKDTISVSIDSLALLDIYKNTIDSFGLKFKIEQTETRGIIQFELTEIKDNIDYVVEFQKSNKLVKKLVMNSENNTVILPGLKAGKYKAIIIEDINKNRRWDAGNYLEHRQSEVIRTVDIEELRENWEIEVIVNWSQVLDEKSKNKNK
ncbi:MAG: Ig-like domain-containing domain [Saprospiraceae bacterium]|nr:Ig-like domain-containing domain [Saprospiraceae bacterium]